MCPSPHSSNQGVALIGDIHGCSAELGELLGAIGGRRIVSLGDVLDRGPDPGGCVDLLRAAGAEVVLGNHEEKHFRWRRHEARRREDSSCSNPMRFGRHHEETQRALSDESWRWLEARCVPYLELPEHGVLAVHAGLHAGVPAKAHGADRICRVQMTKPGHAKKASPWASWRRGPDGQPELWGVKTSRALEDGYRWWTEYLREGQGVVVYGHSVVPSPLVSVDEGDRVVHAFADGAVERREGLVAVGIDTGVPFGGSLTALLLPERTFVRVEAKQCYFGGPDEEDTVTGS